LVPANALAFHIARQVPDYQDRLVGMLTKETASLIIDRLNSPGYSFVGNPPEEWACVGVRPSETRPGYLEVKLARPYRFSRFPNRCTAHIRWDENLDDLGLFLDRLSELVQSRLPDLQDYYSPPTSSVRRWLEMRPDARAESVALWVDEQDAQEGRFSSERRYIELALGHVGEQFPWL